MRQNRIIALNTLASYAQSLVAMASSLFSARWVLMSLGDVDFGLFGVVGSIILLITFLNSGLSIGVGRFYAYSIGKTAHLSPTEAQHELRSWFNTALSTHLTLAVLLAVIGIPVGEYAIHHWMNIPADRLGACLAVFHFSMITALASVVSVPFTAMFSAHQAIMELAFFSMCHSLATLGLAWILLSAPGDKLVFYGFGMMCISVTIAFIQIIRSAKKFGACRPDLRNFFHLEQFRTLFSYVGWKLFGISCVVLRNQGTPVLINLFFNPTINASYNIANRLSIQATSLASSLVNAFQPAIVAAEGKGDTAAVTDMCNRVCRLGSLLVLIFIVPLVLEIDTVLKLWLNNPPPFTSDLCRWLLIMLIMDKMTAGHMIAVNARGKIALYEIIQGSTFLIALPLIWCFHKAGLSPSSIGVAIFISGAIYCVGRVVFAKALTGLPITPWLKAVAVPAIIILTLAIPAGWFVQQNISSEIPRFALTVLASSSVATVFGAFLLITRSEKNKLLGKFLKKPPASTPPRN